MKWAAALIGLFFLGGIQLGLFVLSVDRGEMSSGESDCPFMANHEVWCPMDLFDHISAWQANFVTLVPSVMVFFGLVTVGVLPLFLISVIRPDSPRQVSSTARHWRDIHNPLRELFASGVLHPKVYLQS